MTGKEQGRGGRGGVEPAKIEELAFRVAEAYYIHDIYHGVGMVRLRRGEAARRYPDAFREEEGEAEGGWYIEDEVEEIRYVDGPFRRIGEGRDAYCSACATSGIEPRGSEEYRRAVWEGAVGFNRQNRSWDPLLEKIAQVPGTARWHDAIYEHLARRIEA